MIIDKNCDAWCKNCDAFQIKYDVGKIEKVGNSGFLVWSPIPVNPARN